MNRLKFNYSYNDHWSVMGHQKHHYRVIGFTSDCPHHYLAKLLSFGFLPGTIFQVERKGLFGGPLQIKIRDFSVSLRQKEFAFLKVEQV